MTRREAWTRAAVVLAAVVAADQLTKVLVRGSLEVGERREVFPFLDLVRVNNKGIAFGALGNGQAIVVVIVAAALVGLVVYFATGSGGPHVWLATGLLLGGALGNIFDRLREGAVTDFLKVPHWPAFNVADLAITIGVVALVFTFDAGHDH